MINQISSLYNYNQFTFDKNKKANYPISRNNIKSDTDTVSFGANVLERELVKQKIKNQDNQQIATEFGNNLLAHGNKLNDEIIRNEVRKFFVANKIENVEIKDLSQLPQKNIKANGCFTPIFTDDLEKIKSGTLYLKKCPNTKDRDALITYVSCISHELTHVLQYSKDNTHFGYGREIKSLKEVEYVDGMINQMKAKYLPLLHLKPIEDIMLNYKDFGLTPYEGHKLFEDSNKYQMAFLKKPINVSNDFIAKSLSPDIPLKDYVNKEVNRILKACTTIAKIPKEKEFLAKKSILKRIIYNFKTEREAYKVQSEILKKQFGIQGNSINDVIPQTYKMIEDILQEKLEKEFK